MASSMEDILKKLEAEPPKRLFEVDRASVNKNERAIDLSFSSENPVRQWYGIEVLSHEPGAMRMGRAEGGIPLLFNHNRDIHLGITENCRCNTKEKKGRGRARFSRNAIADEKWRDVEDGILKDVSVSYRVHHMVEVPTTDLSAELMEMSAAAKAPVYRITDWEPVECSMVTVPADPSVGVGRSADQPPATEEGKTPAVPVPEVKVVKENTPTAGEKTREARKMADDRTIEEIEKDMDVQRKKAGDEARDRERNRVQGINDIYEKFRSFIPEFVRRKAVDEGMALTDFQAMALKRMEDPKPLTTPVTEIGLSRQEISRYSITRAILSQWAGAKAAGIDSSFEEACHREIVKRLDQEGQKGGIFVPYDVMRQRTDQRGTGAVQDRDGRRDLTVADGAGGGFLVGTDNLGAEFIDVLRNLMLVRRLGVRVLSGLKGNVTIPKRTAGVSSYWVGEGTAPTEGSNTFAQLALSPKNVGANVDYTRNLLLQSNPTIDALVNGDIALSLATAIDLAAFHGSGGSGQPQGVVGTIGVGSVTATTVDYTKALEFLTDVAAANALAANCAFVTTPAVAAILMQKHKAANTYSPLWVGGILESNDMIGFRGFATNQITAGYMIFGDWSQVILAEWGTLELVVDPYTQSKNGIIQVTAFQTVDVGVRYPGAFTVSTSVTA